jgi:hypothetical protein
MIGSNLPTLDLLELEMVSGKRTDHTIVFFGAFYPRKVSYIKVNLLRLI